MRVLRDNKESLMAVLEAFIHDPLLNWRLGNRESPPEPSFPSERRQSIAGDQHPRQTMMAASMARGIGGGVGGEGMKHRQEGSYRPRRTTMEGHNTTSTTTVSAAVTAGPEQEPREVQNARALQVLARVKEKLTGRDFKSEEELNVEDQVEKLLVQATSLENLCQHYIGWCSFW